MLRVALALGLLAGCPPADAPFTEAELEAFARLSPLPPAPPDPTNAVADDPAAARLGQFLYFDAGLSGDGAISCATCHDPALGFSDGERLSDTLGTTDRHAPTVWNTAYNRWFFWDGRCDSHWCQALGPIESEVEMAGSRLQVAHHVYADPALRAAYEAIFGAMPDLSDTARFPLEGRPVEDDPNHPHHLAWSGMDPADQAAVERVFTDVGKAIAAYERRIVSGPAPFDRFVAALQDGDATGAEALSESAQRGAKLFVGDARCHLCHNGPTFSSGEFMNLGLGEREWLDPTDTGRHAGLPKLLASPFNGAGPYSDDADAGDAKLRYLVHEDELLGQFKASGLREIASSAPYMHGGHFETLDEVVRYYSNLDEIATVGHRDETLQRLSLTQEEVADLVAFLESLSGEPLPTELTEAPASPAGP